MAGVKQCVLWNAFTFRTIDEIYRALLKRNNITLTDSFSRFSQPLSQFIAFTSNIFPFMDEKINMAQPIAWVQENSWFEYSYFFGAYNDLRCVSRKARKPTMVANSVVTNIVQLFCDSRNHGFYEHSQTTSQVWVVGATALDPEAASFEGYGLQRPWLRNPWRSNRAVLL